MTETKANRTVQHGRVFPEIQWSEEKKAQRKAQREAFRQQCEEIFKKVHRRLKND